MGKTRRRRGTSPRPTRLGNGAARQPLPRPTNSPPNARGKGPAAEAPRSARKLGAHRPSAHTQAPSQQPEPAAEAPRSVQQDSARTDPPSNKAARPGKAAKCRPPSLPSESRPPREPRAPRGHCSSERPSEQRGPRGPGGTIPAPEAPRSAQGLGAHRPSAREQGPAPAEEAPRSVPEDSARTDLPKTPRGAWGHVPTREAPRSARRLGAH